jgi:hypothetical protein
MRSTVFLPLRKVALDLADVSTEKSLKHKAIAIIFADITDMGDEVKYSIFGQRYEEKQFPLFR